MILGPWASRTRTVLWGDVSRVDVADGRLGAAGAAGGAAAGLVSAALLAFAYSYISFAGSLGERRPDLGTITVRFAAVLVPVGAIWGGLSTRWRKVY